MNIIEGHLYDDEDNIILCKCGKEASTVIAGKSSFICRCTQCMAYGESKPEFIYRPHSEENELD